MRHVAVSALKDRLSEYLAAAEAGDETVVTRHGREIARIVPPVIDKRAAMREAVERSRVVGDQILARYGPTTFEELREWLEEDRR